MLERRNRGSRGGGEHRKGRADHQVCGKGRQRPNRRDIGWARLSDPAGSRHVLSLTCPPHALRAEPPSTETAGPARSTPFEGVTLRPAFIDGAEDACLLGGCRVDSVLDGRGLVGVRRRPWPATS